MSLARHIGDVIRGIRTARGYTQEEFAHRLKVNRVYMGVVERGEANFNLKTLQKLARGAETPLWRIIKQAEEMGED